MRKEKFDINNITIKGSIGQELKKEDLRSVKIGSNPAYFYKDGDAGCKADTFLIPGSDQIVIINFVECEGNAVSIGNFQEKILSTFKFTN